MSKLFIIIIIIIIIVGIIIIIGHDIWQRLLFVIVIQACGVAVGLKKPD